MEKITVQFTDGAGTLTCNVCDATISLATTIEEHEVLYCPDCNSPYELQNIQLTDGNITSCEAELLQVEEDRGE